MPANVNSIVITRGECFIMFEKAQDENVRFFHNFEEMNNKFGYKIKLKVNINQDKIIIGLQIYVFHFTCKPCNNVL